jgi:hypothetical protein
LESQGDEPCSRFRLSKPLFTLPGLRNSALLALGTVAIDPARPPAGVLAGFQRKEGLTSLLLICLIGIADAMAYSRLSG